ncbi:putative E3 ubiquitin-protein ligase UBR7 isoform X1 [Pygocentrus nattereri]|uniref:UBR-type domain-containing protein n=1 Tax=Pygocentrus nattereri TaxID=42514 RepID=A0AAR2IGQ4_PYGNA|nr:putative E3 ubiquitin-protein ligase UBR7 isoform X1 [Pygocentrus nattereri]XP_017546356.1 putative E3 ubiquitin-protein ligase UBR7 isoform X1 [Pygocentrus nattereri]XP_017546357.1 putative E3 ubiquitin-protein ligase UBR7 isoform X1 [Pygocentrus nattereri]
MAVNEGKEAALSLVDVAEDEELREALAVLAGSDPNQCSYLQGYVKRQAVFACSTCTSEGMEPTGVCLACANHCHDGHDIFELYTKRNFRCDCGNRKFGSFKCKLSPEKDGQNSKNLYNHNYFGRYCSCDRPYPDDDDQVGEEMIQCILCEDWYHSKHLGCAVVDSEELLEMVCESCMNRAPLLWTYAAYFATSPVTSKEDEDVTVVGDEEEKETLKETLHPYRNGHDVPSTSQGCQKEQPTLNGTRAISHKRTHEEMESTSSACESENSPCKLKELKAKGLVRPRVGAVFWPYCWRSKLCTCTSCKRVYVEAGVQFLLDESDTVLAYENRGKALLREDLLMSCLNSLDRVQQLEIIYQYNDMKAELHAFLREFADQGKEVTPEAIRTFFEELQARKRRRSSTGQYYCS